MAKKKWFQAAGLVLLCHLTITACQNQQEISEPTGQRTSVQTSSSKSKKDSSKNQTEGQKTEKTGDKKYDTSKADSKEKAIPGVTVPTSDGFILTDQSKILSRTQDGIVVDHDGHSHFIFYADLKDTKFAHLIPAGTDLTKPTPQTQQQTASTSQQATGDDHHYTFNPADIVAEDALGYTVRHGDHYHYILKSSLTTQPSTVTTVAAAPPLPFSGFGGNSRAEQPAQLSQTNAYQPVSTNQGIAGIDYPTSDGFLFDGTGIQGWTDLGLLVDHGGHLHLILKTDLAKSKWAYLLSSPTEPATSVVTTQSTPSAQPNQPTRPEVFVQPVLPVQPESPLVPPTTPVDELTIKKTYLAAATGLPEEQIILLDTPQGPAFMYPHDDHHHVVLLSKLDVSQPFDDGHGGHNHGDDHAHDEGDDHGHTETTVPNTPTTSEPSDPTQPSEPDTHVVPVQPTTPIQPEVPSEPTKPVQPETPEVPNAPQGDEVAAKRAYLARATSLTEDQIVLLDTPSGPAFMYPHGDHSHLVLLSSLDVTKPFDDGHGGHDHGDDHAHDEGEDHDGHEEATESEAPTAPEPTNPTQPAQPSEAEIPEVPAQPTEQIQPEAPAEPTNPLEADTPEAPTAPQVDEVAAKRAYLAQATGLTEDQIVLLDTPSGPSFMYPHGDHHHVILISQLDVTKPFDDGHGGHNHGDDHTHDEGDDHGHAETTVPNTPTISEPSDPTQPAQPSEPETPEVPAAPTEPIQPEVPAEPTKPVQPDTPIVPTAPQSDEIAAKRTYLAQATGLTEEQIVLLDTPNGPAFMYPHGDHSHLVLLSILDVTKPFDDGHGGHAHNDGDEHGHAETTVLNTPTVSEPITPTQPSEPETPEVPTSAEEVSPPVEPPATVAVGAPTVSEPTEHTGGANPDIPSDSEETQLADSEEAAVVSPVTQPEVPTIPEVSAPGNQETTPELPVTGQPVVVEVPAQPTEPDLSEQPVEPVGTTGPAISEQPEAPTEGVVSTPPVAPQLDEIAVKRAYLAAATGLLEDQILLLNTPAGPSFMYPHGDHHHVILISQLDVTKPFDDGHGNQGKDGEADQGHHADDHHAHDETSQDDGHHDNDGADEEITDPARTQDSEPSTPEAPSDPTATGEVEKATETGGSEEANQPVVPVQPEQPGQPIETTRPEQSEAPVQKGFAGIDYPTSDGFLFDGTGMAGWTSAGLLVDHGGHTHILPTEAIAKSKWAYLLPKEPADTPTAPVELSEHLAKQRENLAKQFGINPEDIRVVTADGKVIGFEYPHEDHYDFVPVSDGENPSGLTDEDKRELTAYIRKTYGLLLGTPVTYHEGFVVFAIPHPHQDYDAKRDYYSDVLDPAYDPGHVHPYAVPLSHLSVLKPTGILELDFENELIAAAKRIGVAPSEVKIKDKKYFVLPGKDHDHYLNMLTPIAGYDAYMANKLPDIKADFALGSYSKAEVEAEADRILAAAEGQFGPGTVEFRRVARALEAFKVNLTVATTSTDGYLKALQSFENKHLKGLVEEEAEATAVDPLVATYLDLSERLKGYDERTLKQYALNAEQVINKLKIMVAIKDEAGLGRVATHFAAIDRAKQASSDLAPRLAYMDFFLKNLDSDKLPASLRQEVIDKLIELQKISGLYRNPQKFREGLEDTALLKAKVKAALAADGPAPDHANWTPYPRGFDRKEMANTVNTMRDFLIKNKEMTAEEMTDGFGKKLDLFPVHPKKPATVVVVPPAQPKPAEKVTKPAEPSQPGPDSEVDKPVAEQPTDSEQTQPEHGDSENTSDSAETVTQPHQPEETETQPADGETTPVEKPVDSSEEPIAGEGDDVTGDSGEDDFDWSGWKPIFDIPVDGDDSSRDPEGAEETDWPVWKPIFEVPEDTDLPVWKPIVDLPEDGATNPVDVLDQPTPEVGGQPGGTEEGSPTPADTSGEEEVTEPGTSEDGPVTADSPSQPSEEEASSDKPHAETEQPGQPVEHEKMLPTPADTSGEEEVTDPGISEVGPVTTDGSSQPSEEEASSDKTRVETEQPGQPAEHEEEFPTPADTSGEEEVTDPGTSEDGPVTADSPSQPSEEEASSDKPHAETEQPGQPVEHEEELPTPADTSGEEEVTEPVTSEDGPVKADSPSQPSEAGASSDKPHAEMEEPGQPVEHEEELPTPADTSGEEEVTDPGTSEVGPVTADAPSQPSEAEASSEVGSISSDENPNPSDQEAATEQPVQPTQPGTDGSEEGAGTGDRIDDDFDWSGWGSILDIPGEDDGIDWGNWFDDWEPNRDTDELPRWTPLFGNSWGDGNDWLP